MKKQFMLLIMAIVSMCVLAFGVTACSFTIEVAHTHNYKWEDNGDGTHKKHCSKSNCDAPDIDSGTHVWRDDETCECGAVKPPEGHVHSYEWVDNSDGTHKRHCDLENCDAPDIGIGDHDYVVIDGSDASCSAAGWILRECSLCKSTNSETVEKVDHEPSEKLYFDPMNEDSGHWQLCRFDCGTELNKQAHNVVHTEYIDATCIARAQIVFLCDGCEYGYTVTDNESVLGDHQYEAYVCRHCGQDIMAEYIDDFEAHGASIDDPITIDEKVKFVMLFDYMYRSQIYGREVFANIIYVHEDSSELMEELTAACDSAMIAATSGSFFGVNFSFSETDRIISVTLTDDSDAYASFYPDSGYPLKKYPQQYALAFADYNSDRSRSFDDFKYYQRTHSISVSTSDQLFNAFAYGYLPVPVPGSVAERILDDAKAVARRIMDDRMTDLEKLRAIYLWLVEEVSYDYGALEYEEKDWYVLSAYYLEGVFSENRTAVCDGISKAYCVLAGLEDIRCVRVSGVIKNDGGGHAWNKVLVDADGDGKKEWYVSDATWGNTLDTTAGETLDLRYFLFTDRECMQDISATNSYNESNCDAVTEINPFAYFFYDGGSDASRDFVIESNAELMDLFECVAAVLEQGVEKSMYLNFYVLDSYCSDKSFFSSELSKIFSKTFRLRDTMLSFSFGEIVTMDGIAGHIVNCYFYEASD